MSTRTCRTGIPNVCNGRVSSIRQGIEPMHQLERYYNAGYIAVPRAQNGGFLDLWIRLCELVMDGKTRASSTSRRVRPDFALPLDGPGRPQFRPHRQRGAAQHRGARSHGHRAGRLLFVACHRLAPSPGTASHIRQALLGVPPTAGEQELYYDFANHPIKAYQDIDRFRQAASCPASSLRRSAGSTGAPEGPGPCPTGASAAPAGPYWKMKLAKPVAMLKPSTERRSLMPISAR